MNIQKKRALASILGITTIASAGLFAGTAEAYRGDYTAEGPDCTSEQHELMEEAFATNNYAAWAELMDGKGRVTEVITADNFAQFAQAHHLGDAGDTAAADAIRTELGLRTSNGEAQGVGYGNGSGDGDGQGQGRGRHAN